jgi:hypothetical protein
MTRERPKLGSNMNSHSMPTAAPGSMCGAKAKVRTNPVNGTFVASREPSARPPTREPTSETVVKISVFSRMSKNSGSENSSLYFSRPTKVGKASRRFQSVKLR